MKRFIRQAEALEQLLNHCLQEGDTYKPIDTAMKSTALQTLLGESRKSIEAVRNAKNDLTELVNIRHRTFDPLPTMSTRIIRALKAAKAEPDMIEDVNRIRIRFRHVPSGKIQDPVVGSSEAFNNPAEQISNDGTTPSTKTPRRKISQLAFGIKAENFAEMVGLLKKESRYTPNESDLTIAALETKLEELLVVNEAVISAKVTLKNARKTCRQMIFGEEGVYGIGMRVKDYYISAFGFNDAKFKSVSKIKFVK